MAIAPEDCRLIFEPADQQLNVHVLVRGDNVEAGFELLNQLFGEHDVEDKLADVTIVNWDDSAEWPQQALTCSEAVEAFDSYFKTRH